MPVTEFDWEPYAAVIDDPTNLTDQVPDDELVAAEELYTVDPAIEGTGGLAL